MRLQDLLEQEFEEGIIEVERSGHCAEFEWTFTWKSHGGNHPEVKVNDSKLTGVQVTTTVTTIQDGGLFMDPIPGEFLRVPSNQTQVSNKITWKKNTIVMPSWQIWHLYISLSLTFPPRLCSIYPTIPQILLFFVYLCPPYVVSSSAPRLFVVIYSSLWFVFHRF